MTELLTVGEWIKNCDSEGSHDVLTIKSVTLKRVMEHLRPWDGALYFSSQCLRDEKFTFYLKHCKSKHDEKERYTFPFITGVIKQMIL